MKRGIIAAVVLACVTLIAVTVTVTLQHKADTLCTLAQYALQDKSQLENLSTEWEKQVIYFELFTDHGYFETIEKKIRKLRFTDGEQYRIICTETLLDIATFKEHISFSPGNVF